MRPSVLDPLFAPVRTLPGIGPRIAPQVARAVGVDTDEPTIRDLLFHLPYAYADRRVRPPLYALPPSGLVTVEGTVERHEPPPPGSRAPYRIILAEGGAAIQLVYFGPRSDWLHKLFPLGARRVVSGAVEWFDMRPQIAHPDYVLPPDEAGSLPAIEPIYSLTSGLSPKLLRRAITAALDRIPALPEWLSPDILGAQSSPSFVEALRALHQPTSMEAVEPAGAAWRRLALDELMANQFALRLVRGQLKRERGSSWQFAGSLRARIEAALPFRLTSSQADALREIEGDLAGANRMSRLLQGDVGSGKTVVALIAMADVAEAGAQSALMAPTDLLARQHFATIAPLAEAAGLTTVLLTGRARADDRAAALDRIGSGEAAIVVGTHALFQGGVRFRRLGLSVIDEQHRFGVHQRLSLSDKGEAPDVLVMTATPIPRTLVLSFFGDMEVSRLTEKPAGRQPIDTRAVPLDRLGEVMAHLLRAVGTGGKAFWICPLVAESEKLDVAAAEERFASLRTLLGDKVDLVHGRMDQAAKERGMERFRSGEVAVLVSTTVIEVGVDVPDATIMVIEHAERFGLAQLHQLRGRVGRGSAQSACLLLYKAPLGETARARLSILRETEDGFRIAEEDLRLRGEGDLLGTRQSGLPAFRLAQPQFHGDLLAVARDEARLALAGDPEFSSSWAGALKVLLHLFGRDDAARLMRSG